MLLVGSTPDGRVMRTVLVTPDNLPKACVHVHIEVFLLDFVHRSPLELHVLSAKTFRTRTTVKWLAYDTTYMLSKTYCPPFLPSMKQTFPSRTLHAAAATLQSVTHPSPANLSQIQIPLPRRRPGPLYIINQHLPKHAFPPDAIPHRSDRLKQKAESPAIELCLHHQLRDSMSRPRPVFRPEPRVGACPTNLPLRILFRSVERLLHGVWSDRIAQFVQQP